MIAASSRRTLAAFAAVACASSCPAYVFILNEDTDMPTKWNAPTVAMRIVTNSDTPAFGTGSFTAGARDAMGLNPGTYQGWNSFLGSFQFSAVDTGTTPTQRQNNQNEMFFSDTVYGSAFEGNTIAVTLSWRTGNERVEADIVFNKREQWSVYSGPRGSNVRLDLRRVALHELGHVIGLGHPDQGGQSVSAIMNSTIGNLDTLATDDRDGGQQLYGPGPFGTQPSNNLFANATVIPSGSEGTVFRGFNNNADKEAAEPLHAGLPGGRSVWWRWTAPQNGPVTITTEDSLFDTLLAVYTGATVSTLVPVASNDDVVSGEIQFSNVAFTATAGTTYHIAVDGFDADHAAISLRVAYGTSPTITTQPQSQTVASGASVAFSVQANGTVTGYQWFKDGTAISGQTSQTLTLTNVQAANAGVYHVRVSGSGASVNSAAATLTITPVTGGGGGGATPAPSTGGGAVGALGAAALGILLACRRIFGPRPVE